MTIRKLLIPLLGLCALFAACAPGAVSETELDEHLCSPEALGDDYQELVRGDFTPRDLAELADPHEGRERELRDAGLERGKFVYYKSVLEKPPFEPPLEVVCQAMEFESEEQAAAWIAGLTEEAAAEALLLGRFRGDATARDSGPLNGSPDSPRTFTIVDQSVEPPLVMFSALGANGRFVRVIASGGQRQFIDTKPDVLASLWEARDGTR